MIKNVVFDVGNVILKGLPCNILNDLDLDSDMKKEIQKKFFCNWEELDLGLVTLKEFFDKCNFSFEISNDLKDKLVKCYKYREFNKDIINLIHILKINNYNVYILSNNNYDTVDYLRSLDFYKDIDGDCFSCFYHVVKPDKEIYEILINKYNLDVSCSLFIDDNQKNIDIAKELGFVTKKYDYSNNNFINSLNDIYFKM